MIAIDSQGARYMLKKKYTKPSLRNLGLLRLITKLSGVGSVGMLRIVPKITDYV